MSPPWPNQSRPEGGYQHSVLSYSTVGPTSLVTTVEDLFLEDRLGPVPGNVNAPPANAPTEVKKERPVLTPEQMHEYTGDFYSEELGVLYTVMIRDGSLLLRYPRGEMPLQTTLPDTFAAPDRYPIRTIQYTRNTDKAITGITINTSRVRNLRFMKVEIKHGTL
jgi:hypothetical protein